MAPPLRSPLTSPLATHHTYIATCPTQPQSIQTPRKLASHVVEALALDLFGDKGYCFRPENGSEAHWNALAQELRDADEDLVKNVDDSIGSLLIFVRSRLLTH
jgi:hypothetical protein